MSTCERSKPSPQVEGWKNTVSTNVGAPDRSHVDIAFYTSTCGDGFVDPNASRESCDPGISNSGCCTTGNPPTGCAFRTNGTVCRSTAGVCDVQETCNGTRAPCP